jgi:hypothetical protein
MLRLVLLALVALTTATAASAQVVGIGTTQAGATGQIATAIAQVVSQRAGGLQMRTQPMAGAAQYIPQINAGQLEFGIANAVETVYAVQGRVIVEGRPNPNLRMVANLFPFMAGLVVQRDGPIRSMADFRGRPIPTGFSGNPLGRVMMEVFMGLGGLTMNDVRPVPVPAFPRMFEAFRQQTTSTTIVALGSGILQEFESALGGIRYVSIDDTPQNREMLARTLPQSYLVTVQPQAGLLGIIGPTNLVAYDYTLFAAPNVPDEVVARVVRTMHDNPDDLKATGPLWREFNPRRMSRDIGVPFHPGAIAAYQQLNIWPAPAQ